MQLTAATKALFEGLAKDAPNWNGSPIVDVSKTEEGNLSDLKKKGLLTTTEEDGCLFAEFTDSGVELARSMGHEISTD